MLSLHFFTHLYLFQIFPELYIRNCEKFISLLLRSHTSIMCRTTFIENKALTIISRSKRKSLRNWFLFCRRSNRNAVCVKSFVWGATLAHSYNKLMFTPIRCGHFPVRVAGFFSGFPWTRKEWCLHLFCIPYPAHSWFDGLMHKDKQLWQTQI